MVSIIGWLDGLTATGIVLFSMIFGLLSLYEAKKYKIKLLAFAGLLTIIIGLYWLGPLCDFLSVLITGKNLSPLYIYAILSYVWTGPGIVVAMYLGAELILPNKKKSIVIFYTVLSIIFQLFIWFDTLNVFTFTLNNPGNDLIDTSFNRAHPCFFIVSFYLISAFIFLGIGFLIKAIQAKGVVRKKFLFLSIGFNVFVICGTLDSVFPPGIAIGFVRFIMMSFALWIYLGLREKPENKEKLYSKKEIKIEGDLFPLTRLRPEGITEEEITFYRELKVCLVCKGKAIRFIYVCPKCDTLYCEHCAKYLEIGENACWYCGEPFDKSKPSMTYYKEEQPEIVYHRKSNKTNNKSFDNSP